MLQSAVFCSPVWLLLFCSSVCALLFCSPVCAPPFCSPVCALTFFSTVLCSPVLWLFVLCVCSPVCALPFVISRSCSPILLYCTFLCCHVFSRSGYLFWHGVLYYGHHPSFVYDLLNNLCSPPPRGGKKIGFPSVGGGKGKTGAPWECCTVLQCAVLYQETHFFGEKPTVSAPRI